MQESSDVPRADELCLVCGGPEWVPGPDVETLTVGDAYPDRVGLDGWDPCPACGPMARERRIRQRWNRSGVSERFRDRSFAGFNLVLYPDTKFKDAEKTQRASVQEAFEAVRALAGGDAPPLLTVMSKYPGTGKTHLAVALIRHVIETQEIEARYVSGPEFGTLARAFNATEGAEDATSFLEMLGRVPVLVLDDVGSEKTSEWLQSAYHGVIDARYMARLRTLIISNCSARELDTRLGARALDRLVEKGTGVVTIIDAASVRERRPM